MAYRKLGRDSKHRRSMLANLTKSVIINERIETTEDRAKETRKFVEKMITYGKKGGSVNCSRVVGDTKVRCIAVGKNGLSSEKYYYLY
jgi:ribosomal protein L17